MKFLSSGTVGTFATMSLMFMFGAVVSYIFQYSRIVRATSFSEFFIFAFPMKKILSKSSLMDVLYYIVTKLYEKFSGGIFAAVELAGAYVVARFVDQILPNHPHFVFGGLEIVIVSLAIFMVSDFSMFISHYLQHFVPVLWELHKVHHSATFMTPITTKRVHPLGQAFDDGVAAIILCIPIGLLQSFGRLTFLEVALLLANAQFIGMIVVLDALRHSHFPISYGKLNGVILSPVMHQLHHSYKVEHWDRNFGNKLAIWDVAFRTIVYPKAGEDVPWGLGKPEQEEYNSLYGAYVGPLEKIFRLVFNRPRKSSDPARGTFFERVVWRSPKGTLSGPEAGAKPHARP